MKCLCVISIRAIYVIMEKKYYHLSANGQDVRNFIACKEDFIYQFNLFAVCTLATGCSVVAFSIEESHPHALLYGTEQECDEFKIMYESCTAKHIARKIGGNEYAKVCFDIYLVDNQDYLKTVACYVIVQSTKDGKAVMFYDYFWGTGSMYFRPDNHIPIWQLSDDGRIIPCVRYGSLTSRAKRRLSRSSEQIPENWLVCQGLILPDNYIDVERFEGIFKTHNCFRTYCSAGRKSHEVVQDRLAMERGVAVDDIEAHALCRDMCRKLFNKDTVRTLDGKQRIDVARELRRVYRLSLRQLAFLVKLPKYELQNYL